MKAPPHKARHASASYRLYVHLVWPTKYRKQVLGEKLTPVVERSSAAAFATFSRLSEIIKMDVLWAEGYRAESVSPGELESVKRHIVNQAEHHRAKFRFRVREDAKHLDYGEAAPKGAEAAVTMKLRPLTRTVSWSVSPTTGLRRWLRRGPI